MLLNVKIVIWVMQPRDIFFLFLCISGFFMVKFTLCNSTVQGLGVCYILPMNNLNDPSLRWKNFQECYITKDLKLNTYQICQYSRHYRQRIKNDVNCADWISTQVAIMIFLTCSCRFLQSNYLFYTIGNYLFLNV